MLLQELVKIPAAVSKQTLAAPACAMCLLRTFLLYGLSAAMGCTPARSATVMGETEGRAVLATDMGVKLGWWLTKGVNPGVPFTLQDTRWVAAAVCHAGGAAPVRAVDS